MSSSLELSSTFLPMTIFGLSGQWGVIAFNSSRKGNGTRKKIRRTMIMNLWWVRENALWLPEVWLVSVSQSSSSSLTEDYNSIKFPKPQNECETATSTEKLSEGKKRHNLGEEIRLGVEKMKTKAEYGEWENRASGKSMKWKKYAFRWRQLG